MKRVIVSTTALITLLLSGLTFAQCHLDGRVYQEGAVVAGYICHEGSWVAMQ